VDELDEFEALLLGDSFGRVKPDQPDGPVVCQQLAHVRLNVLFDVPREVLSRHVVVPVVAVAVRVVSVLGL
jgi:hypothetical protein